jgi:hypothetical protein
MLELLIQQHLDQNLDLHFQMNEFVYDYFSLLNLFFHLFVQLFLFQLFLLLLLLLLSLVLLHRLYSKYQDNLLFFFELILHLFLFHSIQFEHYDVMSSKSKKKIIKKYFLFYYLHIVSFLDDLSYKHRQILDINNSEDFYEPFLTL